MCILIGLVKIGLLILPMLIDYRILWIGNTVEMVGGWHLLVLCQQSHVYLDRASGIGHSEPRGQHLIEDVRLSGTGDNNLKYWNCFRQKLVKTSFWYSWITLGLQSPDFQNLNFLGFGFCMGYINSGDLSPIQSNNGIVQITDFY